MDFAAEWLPSERDRVGGWSHGILTTTILMTVSLEATNGDEWELRSMGVRGSELARRGR